MYLFCRLLERQCYNALGRKNGKSIPGRNKTEYEFKMYVAIQKSKNITIKK